MLKRIYCLIITTLFIFLFVGCQYFTQMNYKDWCDKNDREPAFVFSNGATRTTKTLENKITITAVEGNWIEAEGTGSPVVLQGRSVYLSGFYIGQTEVTYLQWSEVYTWATSNGYTMYSTGQSGVPPDTSTNQPVTQISWRNTIAWCNALSEKEGLTPVYYTDSGYTSPLKTVSYALIVDTAAGSQDNPYVNWDANGYRLPTEAEWEYAAMGGALSHGYVHSGSNNLIEVGQCQDNTGGSTQPVALLKGNELGLYDMSGNLWEICWDWYASGNYGTSLEINPKGTDTFTSKIMRGGYHGDTAASMTNTVSSTMLSVAIYQPYNIEGFRLARSKT